MKAKAGLSRWALDAAELRWTFVCSAGAAEPISLVDNKDGSHTASYVPASDGPYTVSVKYADQEVPCRSVSQEPTTSLLKQ